MLSAVRNFFGRGEDLTPTPSRTAQPKVQDVKAEDYATPQKYLDGAEIPSYYQFQSNMVADEDLKPGMCRNVDVDKRLTVPTRTHLRFLVTATDVIHSWAVPSLGALCAWAL